MTVAAVAWALPRKPTKSFPKKFDASLDDKKSSYAVFSHQPDEDVIEFAGNPFLHTLMAPSSYATYFEQQQRPRHPLLPREESSYSTVPKVTQGVPLAPPPVDSYSSYSGQTGAGSVAMTPPPISTDNLPDQQEESSYLSSDGVGEESLKAPPVPADGSLPTYMTSTEVLASLVAMARMPPPTSSYSEDLPADTRHYEEDNGPSRILLPPSV